MIVKLTVENPPMNVGNTWTLEPSQGVIDFLTQLAKDHDAEYEAAVREAATYLDGGDAEEASRELVLALEFKEIAARIWTASGEMTAALAAETPGA